MAWRHKGPGLRTPANPFTYISKRTNRTVVFMPSGRTSKVEESFEGQWSRAGAHVDVDLGSGVRARVPLALTAAQAATRIDPAFEARVQRPIVSGRGDLDTAVADVVVAWNVYRHFYPYLREVAADAKVEWDDTLRVHLGRMLDSKAATRHDVLAGLVADARDGHGRVSDNEVDARGQLPVFLQDVEGQITRGGKRRRRRAGRRRRRVDRRRGGRRAVQERQAARLRHAAVEDVARADGARPMRQGRAGLDDDRRRRRARVRFH